MPILNSSYATDFFYSFKEIYILSYDSSTQKISVTLFFVMSCPNKLFKTLQLCHILSLNHILYYSPVNTRFNRCFFWEHPKYQAHFLFCTSAILTTFAWHVATIQLHPPTPMQVPPFSMKSSWNSLVPWAISLYWTQELLL